MRTANIIISAVCGISAYIWAPDPRWAWFYAIANVGLFWLYLGLAAALDAARTAQREDRNATTLPKGEG